MSREPTARPNGDAEPERSAGAPHPSRHRQVIGRRVWLVLVVSTVTAANDPLEGQRGPVGGARVSGMGTFVDPIDSGVQAPPVVGSRRPGLGGDGGRLGDGAQITGTAASPYVAIPNPAVAAPRIQGSGRIDVFLGVLLGLILGSGAAFRLEPLDRSVRAGSEVESLPEVPVLGVIPRLRPIEERAEGGAGTPHRSLPLVVATDPLDPAAGAYRNLLMNLGLMGTQDAPIRSVLFSSPGPSEGKSTTAINFAVVLAQQGQKVLVVDADLRRPSLHRAVDVLREPGLTSLLIGDTDLREAIRPSVLPHLDLLASGPFPPNPSGLLSSDAMGRLLENLERRYDRIVIDSPPVLAVTDAAVLAAHMDGAVLVLRSGQTEQRTAERSVEQLLRLGVRVFGAVLNEVSAAVPDGGHRLRDHYGDRPGDQAPEGRWSRLRAGLSRVRFFG